MKQEIFRRIMVHVEEELSAIHQASKAAYDAATHEENRAEDQYDTRGLEASYLARAQSQRVEELERSVSGLKHLSLPEKPTVVVPGTLVELDQEGKNLWIFFLPFGAGITVAAEGIIVSVVTHLSPLGQEIKGKKVGDIFELTKQQREYEILKVI